jgi:hypothetical protein
LKAGCFSLATKVWKKKNKVFKNCIESFPNPEDWHVYRNLFRIIQRKPEKLSFRLAAVSGKQKSCLFRSPQLAAGKKVIFLGRRG